MAEADIDFEELDRAISALMEADASSASVDDLVESTSIKAAPDDLDQIDASSGDFETNQVPQHHDLGVDNNLESVLSSSERRLQIQPRQPIGMEEIATEAANLVAEIKARSSQSQDEIVDSKKTIVEPTNNISLGHSKDRSAKLDIGVNNDVNLADEKPKVTLQESAKSNLKFETNHDSTLSKVATVITPTSPKPVLALPKQRGRFMDVVSGNKTAASLRHAEMVAKMRAKKLALAEKLNQASGAKVLNDVKVKTATRSERTTGDLLPKASTTESKKPVKAEATVVSFVSNLADNKAIKQQSDIALSYQSPSSKFITEQKTDEGIIKSVTYQIEAKTGNSTKTLAKPALDQVELSEKINQSIDHVSKTRQEERPAEKVDLDNTRLSSDSKSQDENFESAKKEEKTRVSDDVLLTERPMTEVPAKNTKLDVERMTNDDSAANKGPFIATTKIKKRPLGQPEAYHSQPLVTMHVPDRINTYETDTQTALYRAELRQAETKPKKSKFWVVVLLFVLFVVGVLVYYFWADIVAFFA